MTTTEYLHLGGHRAEAKGQKAKRREREKQNEMQSGKKERGEKV